MKYAVFLRGINVGGIKVSMAELRALLQTLPVANIATFAQTGNVVLESDLAPLELKMTLEREIGERFHYEAIVLISTLKELGDVVAGYPFAAITDKHRYVVFCDSQEVVTSLVAHRAELDLKVEDIAASNRAVYWQTPIGSSTVTTFAKLISKAAYKSHTTNRNLNTLEKMLPAES